MITPGIDIKPQLEGLLSNSFKAFCDDISGMFGIEMKLELFPGSKETAQALKKKFKKLSAVATIKASGILEGDLRIAFDKKGLFALAGTIEMLPEEKILANQKAGSEKYANELYDAVGEAGNLLVGPWDRIFREELEGHAHLLHIDTFIGNPWDDPQKDIGITKDEEFLFFPCDITVGSIPAFHCGVLFPEAMLQKITEEIPATVAEEQEVVSEVSEEPENESPEPQEEDASPDVSVEPESQETADEHDASPDDSAETKTQEIAEDSKSEEAEPQDDTSSGLPAETESDDRETAKGTVSETIQKMVRSLPVIPSEYASALLNVPAKDIMTEQILWAKPEDSVQHAIETMQQADAACILVGNSSSLEGIVAWIDIAEAVSVYLRPVFAKWRRPADDATLQIKLKIVMTRPVRTIKPQTPLAAIMEDMCQHRLRCLPVVNEQGTVEGVVTAYDIFRGLLKISPDLPAADPTPQPAPSLNQ
ncbi:MAG: CBS domain-containing protein [Deltaproteobacteria bacterium]|nr:CBS domain-containing protein [Deltaproteobacteria bacterium]